MPYATELSSTITATVAQEAEAHGFLNPNDGVAISFWIISIMMVAATVFFLMESMAVGNHWKTSMNVGALVTLVAGVHYFYMREFWVQIHASPILYRYIDWSITVPLQMIEFNLILKAVNPNIGAGMFWRLMIRTICMLLFGYCGETSIIGAWVGFALGLGYVVTDGMLVAMGRAGSLPAALAAWSAPAIFACIGVALLLKLEDP